MTEARGQKANLNGSARAASAASGSPWLDAGPNGEGLQVFDFPTYIVGRISGIVRRSLIPRYVEPAGLSIPEWRLLAFLVLTQPASFNEICAALTMDRAQVSRTIPVLLRKWVIKRMVTRRKGPRRRGEGEHQAQLTATPKGRALYRRALPVAQRHQMVLLGALDTSEREAFYTALRKVTRAAEQFEQQQLAEAKSVKRSEKQNGKSARKANGSGGRKTAAVRLRNSHVMAGGVK